MKTKYVFECSGADEAIEAWKQLGDMAREVRADLLVVATGIDRWADDGGLDDIEDDSNDITASP